MTAEPTLVYYLNPDWLNDLTSKQVEDKEHTPLAIQVHGVFYADDKFTSKKIPRRIGVCPNQQIKIRHRQIKSFKVNIRLTAGVPIEEALAYLKGKCPGVVITITGLLTKSKLGKICLWSKANVKEPDSKALILKMVDNIHVKTLSPGQVIDAVDFMLFDGCLYHFGTGSGPLCQPILPVSVSPVPFSNHQ